jgi:hypothetical protein
MVVEKFCQKMPLLKTIFVALSGTGAEHVTKP